MKLLLIIALFVTVNGMAQDTITFSLSDRIRNVDTNPFRVGTVVLDENNAGAIRNATFAEELLFLLQDYEKECYNDSIKYTDGWMKSFENGDYIIIGDNVTRNIKTVDKCGCEYYHKKPTFDGFIKWLKEK